MDGKDRIPRVWGMILCTPKIEGQSVERHIGRTARRSYCPEGVDRRAKDKAQQIVWGALNVRTRNLAMGIHGRISSEEVAWIPLVAVWKIGWKGKDESRSMR